MKFVFNKSSSIFFLEKGSRGYGRLIVSHFITLFLTKKLMAAKIKTRDF
jgi:hypothetical protein